jgi:type I restriction enzyme S subunit
MKLPELGKFGRGKSKHRPRNDPQLYGGGYPFIQTGDIGRAVGRITSHSQTYNDTGLAQSALWPKGTVCITIAANIAETAILSYPACFPDSVVGLVVNPTLCIPEYVEYFIRTVRTRLADFAPSTAQKNINVAILNEVEIPLPPLPEQKRIAAILDKADAIRRKRQEAIRLTEELLRSAFLEMFGDPVTNPKGWEQACGSKVFQELRYGTSQKCHSDEKRGLPVLRIPNVATGAIDWTDLKYTECSSKEVANLTLRQGDLLFVRSNGNPDYIGRCAVYDSESSALYASYLIRARLDSGWEPWFLQAQVSAESYRAVLRREAQTTAGNYNVSTAGLRNLSFIKPPLVQQRRFVSVLRRARSLAATANTALAEQAQLGRSLTQLAFSGGL